MAPRRSTMVWALTAALVERKSAHGKQRQAQIDGRRIQRVERFLETQPDVLAPMQFDRDGNQAMAERLEQAPVAPLVGIGQGGAGYPAANPDVVELGCAASSGRPPDRASPRAG
jgi:hypothetical protein